MGKYGVVAIEARHLMCSGRCADPREAWNISVEKIFPNQLPSQKKGCPRGAYLGLCEVGAVRGIDPGNYTRSHQNKAYAIAALKHLKANPMMASDSKSLWKLTMKGVEKVENGQMDVVLNLWDEGYLNLDSV